MPMPQKVIDVMNFLTSLPKPIPCGSLRVVYDELEEEETTTDPYAEHRFTSFDYGLTRG